MLFSYISEYGSLEVAMEKRDDLFKVLHAIFPVRETPWDFHAIYNETSKSNKDKFPRTLLLLSASQLIKDNFPLPLKGELRARLVCNL